ncbi:MAG: HIT domain-containing protein [Salinirussus sp.]
MDQLFAPWRIEWVERDEPNAEVDGCVFCTLATGSNDREHRVVARSEHAYVLLNNYPYNPGHAMVIPTTHEGSIGGLDDEYLLAKERLLGRTIEAMDAALEPEGYNIGYNLGGAAAGGSIADHLHAHVVPRWRGDTNFMPVIGDTKVIVEAIADTYDRLREAFAAQDDATDQGEDAAVLL